MRKLHIGLNIRPAIRGGAVCRLPGGVCGSEPFLNAGSNPGGDLFGDDVTLAAFERPVRSSDRRVYAPGRLETAEGLALRRPVDSNEGFEEIAIREM
ncbi:MAG: hypothetical protein PSV23_05525 [Brevundimonas sp.]|nr:hypothetical protein [Brevundimonas sp.]MDI1326243.1 hypothetical protein [Brevundimonas sp.]